MRAIFQRSIELNAMSSDVFVSWLEARLMERRRLTIADRVIQLGMLAGLYGYGRS